MHPRVTVVIPVFNHERFIAECVESVLAQDYANLETIVVDDGSTDRTPSILAQYGDRLRILRQENAGAARALNRGIAAANGEWIGWLSSDDVYIAGKITAQMATAVVRPSAGLLYTDWIAIDAEGRELSRHVCTEIEPSRALWSLLQGNFINGSSVLIRRDVFERNGIFEEGLQADVDGEMWFRLLRANVGFARTPGFFLRYRMHSQNMSRKLLLMRLSMDATRVATVRAAKDTQLFPMALPGENDLIAPLLVRALLRQECFRAASLTISLGVASRRLARPMSILIPLLHGLGSRWSEPVISARRFVRRLTTRTRHRQNDTGR